MTITHHLDDATLMSFAAGSLPAALSAVAAAHVAMCTRCRREVAGLERVGGALLAELLPATLDRAEPPASAISGQTPRPDVHENRQRAARGLTPFLRSPVLCPGPCRRRSLACSPAISMPSGGGGSGSACGITAWRSPAEAGLAC